MDIVRGDIKRIDRLITDISDASRLDAELSRETREPRRAVAGCWRPSSKSTGMTDNPARRGV